jgi:hypothetical protein
MDSLASAAVQVRSVPPESEAAVRTALGEILASPEFRASQKCQSFLTYVVEEALAGRHESLKERVIGAEVFGRAPGFETSGDSIVRVKATEVRRRLAKYYKDRPAGGLHIELPTGSYVPVFHWDDTGEPVAPEVVAPSSPRRRLSRRALTGLLLGGVGMGVGGWVLWPRPRALDAFWAPLLAAPGPLVVCASGAPGVSVVNQSVIESLRRPYAPGATIRLDQLSLSRQAQTSWPTVQALVDITRMLAVTGKPFQVRVAAEMSFEQVNGQPLVVIGMFSNPWTIELTRHLRFSFAMVADGYHLVTDAQQPEQVRHVRGLYPVSEMAVDYALVTRVLDAQGSRRVIAIGGISGLGTRVAADFATNERSWEQVARIAPAGWENRNLQVLLETRIVGDTPSPPTIVAIHSW